MGGTEPVKEVNKRNTPFDGRHMSHTGQVHNFLYAARGQHSKTGLPAGHDILLVAENAQGAGGNCTGGYIENCRQQLTGHIIHIGQHQ